MELWMAVDAHNKGVDAQNGVLKGLYSVHHQQRSQIRIPLMRSRNRIRIHIRIKLKSLIRTCIKLMQIGTLQLYMAFVLGFFHTRTSVMIMTLTFIIIYTLYLPVRVQRF
jgi:hypothetical protein